ncbi:DUF4815 domain-containing protein [Rhizobium laguerreae]|uniref:DUF4815 domain-containing protein n=1 Tax=Rhizobium laguerreae TaxID=1076926 RepID=UPI001C92098B|nr:DUF4815 domain-containing protein [Rhizobium laguerreae]MBY3434819.1 DUF4815 domain-containing protein [Rhizobium laguerreae]MBY3448962.1 DUF4815 domain-containing protein [Rhizobium laguerreae]MBY3456736.1 DUF4815 domain-containing protein [Rhizobium laguerreae]
MSTYVFDPDVNPELARVRDRFADRPGNERVYFGEGDLSQGADLNEAFSIEGAKRKAIGDLVARDGDRLDGGDVIVDIDAETVAISDGEIYIAGGRRSVPAATLTAVPMTGDVKIGVRLSSSIVTAEDDVIYLGLVEGAEESYGEPGGIRTVLTFAWAYDTDGAAGEFYPYLTLRDGTIISQDDPPTLSGIQQQIATYDYDAHENYVVRGCVVSPLGLESGKQVFSIGEGRANIMGFKRTRPTSSRYSETEIPDTGLVDAEPHTFDDSGSGTAVITVRRPPISAVTLAVVTKQRTVSLTKGVTDGIDALPDDSVTSIISVVQGATTYTQGVHYALSGDSVDWLAGGIEPATSSTYDVTYRYLDSVVPTAITATTISVAGGVTGTSVLVGYTNKLPRTDRICLDQEGNVAYLKGLSAPTQPQAPQVPKTLLSLATIYNDWFGTPTVINDAIRAYPFSQIDRMYKNVLDLFNQVSLQKQKIDIGARAPGETTGIFSDPLLSDEYRDAGEAQNGAVFDGSFQIPITASFQEIDAGGSLFLPYTDTTFISQELVSGCVKINPYQSFAPLPAILRIVPSEDFWTQRVTVWLSEQTRIFGSGNRERVTSTEVLTNVRTQPLRFLREISVSFTISQFGPGETLDALTFDGVDVDPGGLVANGSGVITGSFMIPAGVSSGVKRVLATGGSGTICASNFTGEGRIERIELQQVTSVQRFQTPPVQRVSVRRETNDQGNTDPQAQSFVFTEGRHVSSVEIKFCLIGDRSQPVILEFVTVDNGFPTTEIIAQTEVDMQAVLAGTWTKFEFPVPFYLPPGQMFAFVVKSNDPDHSISVADRGQFDAVNQQWIAGQPYTIGTRFSSSNAVSWTVHQDSDITFRLNCAAFSPTTRTVSLGTYAATNVSDLIIRANVFLPTEATSVVFEVTFGSETPIRILPDQVWERSDFFTGDITVRAILTGNALVTPVVGRDILMVLGTMQANGVYVSRGFTFGADVRLDVIASTKLPVGSTLVVEADAMNDVWQVISQTSATPIDLGFIERTYSDASFAAPTGGRLRLTLTGTPAARPSVSDLRSFTV